MGRFHRVLVFFAVACGIALASSEQDGYRYDRLSAPSPSSLTLDRLSLEINKRDTTLTSIESVLDWISKNAPTLLQHYTLVRSSESLQGASDLHPRAIAFGTDARLMLTFNGNPGHVGYQNLELIQARDTTVGLVYEFREISFSNGRGHVSEANPTRCYRCHGAPLRPIWQQYEVWNGVYGKFDDAIRDVETERPRPETPEKRAELRAELAAFKTYQGIRAKHPRYKYLRVSSDSKHSPYGESHRPYPPSLRPNLELTSFLSLLQAKRLTDRLWSQGACFQKYGAALVHNLMACPHTAELGELTLQAREKIQAAFPKLKGLRWHHLGNPELLTPKQFFLPLFGIEARDWSLENRPTEWSFYDGSNGSAFEDYVAESVYAVMKKTTPALPTLHLVDYRQLPRPRPGLPPGSEPATPDYEPEYVEACAALAERMKSDVGYSDDCYPLHDPAPIPETLRTCTSCHDGSQPNSPAIKWAKGMFAKDSKQASQLEARLRSTGANRMPPTRDLTERERLQILDFLVEK